MKVALRYNFTFNNFVIPMISKYIRQIRVVVIEELEKDYVKEPDLEE